MTKRILAKTSELYEFVILNGEQPTTDSRLVAKFFSKRHADVLRAFDNLECSAEFNQRNYELAEYTDEKGEKRRQIIMTKDGFIFLAMGFTGKNAAMVKERYIAAFNHMVEILRTRDLTIWQEYQALTIRDANSKDRASHGSRLLFQRKKELPSLKEEMERLEEAIQPRLFQ